MDKPVLGHNDTYTRLCQQVTDRGPWQQTASGSAFFLADPRPEEVYVEDIAEALSRQCRYNGHLRREVEHYSVAQHACLVSSWLEADGYPVEVVYAGLHHDSAEAYTGDIVSQVKWIIPEFKALERRVESAVFAALGVMDGPDIARTVKEYDMMALSTERRDVLSDNHSPMTWGNLPPPSLRCLTPLRVDAARAWFLSKHYRLLSEVLHERHVARAV
jgi:hypothetical protein